MNPDTIDAILNIAIPAIPMGSYAIGLAIMLWKGM